MEDLAKIRADYASFSPPEAHHWARKLRKLGFSPVESYFSEPNGGYELRCNWPYVVADMPVDLVDWLEQTLAFGGRVLDCLSETVYVQHRADARRVLRIYGAARLAMGSRPLPRTLSPEKWESNEHLVAWDRVVYEA